MASIISCTFKKNLESTTYNTDLVYDTPNPSRGLVACTAGSELSIGVLKVQLYDLVYDTPNPSRGLVVSFAYSELSILKSPENTTYKTDLIYFFVLSL